jgi:hypothetical protein
MVYARKSTDGLRDFAKRVNAVSPGLYQELRKVTGDLHEGTRIIQATFNPQYGEYGPFQPPEGAYGYLEPTNETEKAIIAEIAQAEEQIRQITAANYASGTHGPARQTRQALEQLSMDARSRLKKLREQS